MRSLIRDLQRRLRITTLFVTHDQREAVEMGDRIAILLERRVAQIGPPREFYTDPASADVARFFGWCVLSGARNGAGFRAADGLFQVPQSADARASVDAVAFHPSRATLAPMSSVRAINHLPATVEYVTDLGVHMRVGVRLVSGQRVDITQTHDASSLPIREGAASLVVAADGVRFFTDSRS
jgi:ABC-type sugar transport system ATPase subunit